MKENEFFLVVKVAKTKHRQFETRKMFVRSVQEAIFVIHIYINRMQIIFVNCRNLPSGDVSKFEVSEQIRWIFQFLKRCQYFPHELSVSVRFYHLAIIKCLICKKDKFKEHPSAKGIVPIIKFPYIEKERRIAGPRVKRLP